MSFTTGQASDSQRIASLTAELATVTADYEKLRADVKAAEDRAERALDGEATEEDCEDSYAHDVQELLKKYRAAESRLSAAASEVEGIVQEMQEAAERGYLLHLEEGLKHTYDVRLPLWTTRLSTLAARMREGKR